MKWEKKKEARKPKTGLTPSDQDEEKSKKSIVSLTEQKNELGAKNEVAAKPERDMSVASKSRRG